MHHKVVSERSQMDLNFLSLLITLFNLSLNECFSFYILIRIDFLNEFGFFLTLINIIQSKNLEIKGFLNGKDLGNNETSSVQTKNLYELFMRDVRKRFI